MPRGRKKDLSIPQTRALTTQRAYRARKAQYLTELEDRCQLAEEENARLRAELEATRASVANTASARTRETVAAATELMQNLAAASSSLAQFQQLAFPAFPLDRHSESPSLPTTSGVSRAKGGAPVAPGAPLVRTGSAFSSVESGQDGAPQRSSGSERSNEYYPAHPVEPPPRRYNFASPPVAPLPEAARPRGARLSIASLVEQPGVSSPLMERGNSQGYYYAYSESAEIRRGAPRALDERSSRVAGRAVPYGEYAGSLGLHGGPCSPGRRRDGSEPWDSDSDDHDDLIEGEDDMDEDELPRQGTREDVIER